jgi:FKBP-type peptidyl-prolyl cis-trans isomerase
MPKPNSLRERRRAARAARRRTQKISVAGLSGLIVLLTAFLIYQNVFNQPDTITTASGLQYQELAVGEGPAAKAGDTVSVHYTGTLQNGQKFDSSVDRGVPFTLTLGLGSVIQGWEEGLLGMQVGGKRKLIIPSNLGYGATGSGQIPPNATLIFDVELLSIDNE